MKAIWVNRNGDKIIVRVLIGDEFQPWDLPQKVRVQKETVQSGQGIFLINKDRLTFIPDVEK